MNEGLGPMSFQHPDQTFPGQELVLRKDYSEHTAELIDQEVSRLVRDNEMRAFDTLKAHRKELDAIAAALQEKETLTDKDIRKMLVPFEKKAAANSTS